MRLPYSFERQEDALDVMAYAVSVCHTRSSESFGEMCAWLDMLEMTSHDQGRFALSQLARQTLLDLIRWSVTVHLW